MQIGIKIGNGSVLWSTHSGTVNLRVNVGHLMIPVSLTGVLCIPEWHEVSLISWKQIDRQGKAYLHGSNGVLEIRLIKDDQAILRAHSNDGIYTFPAQPGQVHLSKQSAGKDAQF